MWGVPEDPHGHFNSQPRKGADAYPPVCDSVPFWNFNSQPRKGVDTPMRIAARHALISTHSPARGLTQSVL